MGLEEYRRKRDFTRTSEPSGDPSPASTPHPGPRPLEGYRPWQLLPQGERFCVQMHRATRLHWDLRLEHRGVLLSWAVPRGPTLDPSQRRLAMQTEDHPLDYGDFEGVIPSGYGMGTVMLWDTGTLRFEHVDIADIDHALAHGDLKFELDGSKLRGRFALVRGRGHRTAAPGGEGDRGWLLIKKRGSESVPGFDAKELNHSVRTGRSLDEIAADAGGDPRRPARRSGGHRPEASTAPAPPGETAVTTAASIIAGAPAVASPGPLRPMLATPVDRPFSRDGWLFELKYDGVRVLATVGEGEVSLRGRNGRDESRRYPELQALANQLKLGGALVDGEVIALNGEGAPDFERLQSRINLAGVADIARGATAVPVTLAVFDILHAAGRDLSQLPLRLRKQVLAESLDSGPAAFFVDHVERDGEDFFDAVRARGLEGMIAKRADSPYSPGRRSPAWAKVKAWLSQDCVICGFTQGKGGRGRLGALAVAVSTPTGLVWAGKVGSGLDEAHIGELLSRLRAAVVGGPAVEPPASLAGTVTWVRPEIVAELRFAGWTSALVMRHPTFRRLRSDLRVEDCVRQSVQSPAEVIAATDAVVRPSAAAAPAAPRQRRRGGPAVAARAPRTIRAGAVRVPEPRHQAALDDLAQLPANATWELDGRTLKLTNLDKVFWPAEGITKRDMIAHYVRMAPVMLPYLHQRPLSMQMFPDGITGTHFWRKDRPSYAPDWMPSFTYHGEEKTKQYILVEEAATLAWIANHGVVDLHPWHSRADAPTQPDWAVFDLDPFAPMTFAEVVTVARLVKTALDHFGLHSVVKTSGQTGLQIYVPLRRGPEYAAVRGWVEEVARAIGRVVPDMITWEWAVRRRDGRLRIDYTQNIINKTLAAPYSLRPEAGAPVSTPLSWDELDDPGLRPNGWTIATIAERINRRGDLFEPVLLQDQDLPGVAAIGDGGGAPSGSR